jgi:hypothetical protein
MDSLDQLADDIATLISRADDAIFNAVRSQMRGEGVESAKLAEKRLSKVRRALRKAEALLREEAEPDDD